MGIKIRIKQGHQLNGEGEKLGKDVNGKRYVFWKSYGEMDVPFELAIQLQREVPQRYEIVNKDLVKNLIKDDLINQNIQPAKNPPKEVIKIDKTPVIEILDQVEKVIALNKDEQLSLMGQLKIVPDLKGKEFDRVRKIILSGYKLV